MHRRCHLRGNPQRLSKVIRGCILGTASTALRVLRRVTSSVAARCGVGRDLPYGEVLRTWQGLTVGDRGCNPKYKPTRTWAQIAQENPNNRYAREQAGEY